MPEFSVVYAIRDIVRHAHNKGAELIGIYTVWHSKRNEGGDKAGITFAHCPNCEEVK